MAVTAINCPFCGICGKQPALEFSNCFAFLDAFPLSPGHTLIVPKKHVASLFDLPAAEQQELWNAVARVREKLQGEFQPDGFNIGLNDGPAAGQTIMHTHIHVVPRYKGDVADPRGGIRWIIPERAAYWEKEG